jgi:hypothetical protein
VSLFIRAADLRFLKPLCSKAQFFVFDRVRKIGDTNKLSDTFPYWLLINSYKLMNALSIPTWIIHVSSVIEWIVAIALVWKYGEVTGHKYWWALSWGMLPALISAMCACPWHFFDNPASLDWLVTIQAATTVLGNITLCWAGWWIWRTSRPVS